LSGRYAKEPTNVEVLFKLAEKYNNRYTEVMQAKAKELYQKVVAVDPEGKQGSYTYEYQKATVPYTQAAEFELGQMASFGRKPDPAPLLAFIKKYPSSPLVESGYEYLSNYYGYQAPKEEAVKFFEEWVARFPDKRDPLAAYVRRIIRDKGDLDKGLQLAEKVRDIEGYDIPPRYVQDQAQLYVLKGDKAKADELYGKDFIADQVDNLAYALRSYAEFWAGQNENLASAEAMIEKALLLEPDEAYFKQSAANVYLKLGKEDKALAVYGPEFVKKNAGDANPLFSYASFWNRQGRNLESAAEAVKMAVGLEPSYYGYDVLGQIQLKLKNYEEALQAAEKALALARDVAKKNEGFPTKPYEDRVQKVKDAIAKEKK
jgi:tetratricopeptide (TPR) repeat protein